MKQILMNILSHNESRAKFFNTLSLVEYIGARKIIKSQKQESYNIEMLNHVAEEIRHSQTLKRAALRIAPEMCQTYKQSELFCGLQAIEYVQTIDKSCGEYLLDAYSSYLCTTYLLEVRVMEFYSEINELLLENQQHSPFRSILHEEKGHFKFVEEKINENKELLSKTKALTILEKESFDIFFDAMRNELMS